MSMVLSPIWSEEESLCTGSSWCRTKSTWCADVWLCLYVWWPCVYVREHVCLYTRVSMHVFACMNVCMHVWACVCAFVSVNMFVHLYTWMRMCVCVLTNQYFEIIVVFTIYKSLHLKVWVIITSWKLRWHRRIGPAFHRAALNAAPASSGGHLSSRPSVPCLGFLICSGRVGIWANTSSVRHGTGEPHMSLCSLWTCDPKFPRLHLKTPGRSDTIKVSFSSKMFWM